jgi:tetratricopeptide (TPR) repeat protein
MEIREKTSASGEEIIAPIRVRAPGSGQEKPPPWKARRLAMSAGIVLVVALAGAGAWWIDYLSRHPLQAPAGALQPEAPTASSRPPTPPAGPAAEEAPPPSEAPAALETPTLPPVVPDTAKAETVKRLLASADRWSAAGSLSAAQSDFQEALRLDPQSREARAGLQRVKSRMAEEEFRRWMAEGLKALNAGDAATARARLLKAQALRPEAPEVKEALAQAEGRLRSARIEVLRQKALACEQREDWAGALAAYEEALALEPNLQFALQGKERSAALAALERRVEFFVNQPEVLGSDTQLDQAVRLLQDIQSAPPAGPRFAAEAEKLKALVQTAKTPLRITIESDNLTEVSVYRVGKLGRFGARDLNLRPGTYIMLGSRDGYRDERLEVVVKPGLEPIRVILICRIKV